MKRLKTEPEKELTKAELEVMQILWKLKKAFVGDILDRMVEPQARLQYRIDRRTSAREEGGRRARVVRKEPPLLSARRQGDLCG